jgi:uncharacterized membrane protein YhiD involved in acid resistance
MIFTFASLAAGISCGVYAYVIGIVGTIGFCAIAFILRYSPLSQDANLTGIISFQLPKASEELRDFETVLEGLCRKFIQIRYRFIQGKTKKVEGEEREEPQKMIAYEYHVKLKNPQDGRQLDTALSGLSSIKSLKINFEDSPENV